jgi:hypothetical protein
LEEAAAISVNGLDMMPRPKTDETDAAPSADDAGAIMLISDKEETTDPETDGNHYSVKIPALSHEIRVQKTQSTIQKVQLKQQCGKSMNNRRAPQHKNNKTLGNIQSFFIVS